MVERDGRVETFARKKWFNLGFAIKLTKPSQYMLYK